MYIGIIDLSPLRYSRRSDHDVSIGCIRSDPPPFTPGAARSYQILLAYVILIAGLPERLVINKLRSRWAVARRWLGVEGR